MSHMDFYIYLITFHYNNERGLGYTRRVCSYTSDTKWLHQSVCNGIEFRGARSSLSTRIQWKLEDHRTRSGIEFCDTRSILPTKTQWKLENHRRHPSIIIFRSNHSSSYLLFLWDILVSRSKEQDCDDELWQSDVSNKKRTSVHFSFLQWSGPPFTSRTWIPYFTCPRADRWMILFSNRHSNDRSNITSSKANFSNLNFDDILVISY